jgi:choline dehydrogenase-like flavoprotein
VSGSVHVFADYDRDVAWSCDVVVVGSGPGGAVVAYELAERGRDVVLIEEGPPFTPSDFVLDGSISMARTLREGGLRATRGFVMPTMQAIALGGGSLVNSAICVRAPVATLDSWCEEFALHRTRRVDLDPHYQAIEDFLGIAATPDEVQGPRNLLFRDACNALGISSEPIARNVHACRGSGECFTGCRARAKQSMDISYVPAAIRAGCRVLTSAQVASVERVGGRVSGVRGRFVAPFTGKASHRFRVDAKAVVLAAGCMATPVLLQKSGDLANRSGAVGRFLQFHPGVAIMGVFPGSTRPGFGATQGYQSLHFVPRGFKLETLWAPPGVLAVRIPGMGHDLKRNLAEFRRAAVWDAIASCNRSFGRVRTRPGTLDPALSYRLDPRDVEILREALWVLAQLFFAGGAEKIIPGVNGLPDELHTLTSAEVLRRPAYGASDLTCGGNHAFSSTRMHGDPKQGVVDEDGRCHDVENLYVADTGILPRSPSVNPMLTAMALARRVALGIADGL